MDEDAARWVRNSYGDGHKLTVRTAQHKPSVDYGR